MHGEVVVGRSAIQLIVAVEAGMSRRAAAERFGVAVASAIRWVGAWRATGATRAKPQGGDQRSYRIEAMTALWVLDGPMNVNAFGAYVEQVLVHALTRGDIVVMDNLASPRQGPEASYSHSLTH